MTTIRFSTLLFLLLLGSTFLATHPATANPPGTTFTVTSTLDEPDAALDGMCSSTPSGVCTLRAAIQEANSYTEADTIVVPAGTYVLTRYGNDDINLEGDIDVFTDMTITGAGSDETIIDANRQVTADRALHVHDDNGIGNVTVTISGVTLRNGIAVTGGGVLLTDATLTLENVVVQDNRAFNSVGTTRGGGIENDGGYLTLNKSTVQENTNQCVNCNGYGGGIDSINESTLILQDSTISNNNANTSGGGIFNTGTLLIFNSTVYRNIADSNGGGLYTNVGTVTSVNSTFSENGAGTLGGGMYLQAGPINLYNTTITQNDGDADNNGPGSHGGIYGGIGTVTMRNSILASNYGANSDDDCGSSQITSAGYNLIQTTTNCSILGDETGNLYGVAAGLLLIGDNGGVTLTHALSPDSPAIDAGHPTGCLDQSQAYDLDMDQRGYLRPVDGGSGEVRCDMGAFEYGATPPPPILDNVIYLPLVTR